jgi:hypothetical protein
LTREANILIFFKNKLWKNGNLMKKGKTSPIVGFKNAKVIYGTVDSVNFKSVYLNIQTWVEPIIDSENWTRVVLNLSRAIRHTIYEILDRNIFEDNFIVDLDLRASGLVKGKKSFLNLEINLYFKEVVIDFKSKKLKDILKKMTRDIMSSNFSKNQHFKFHLRKTNKIKEPVLQS